MNDAERHLMTIFSTAIDRDPGAERAAYLDAACSGDAGLRSRIEALLRAHEHAEQLPGVLGDSRKQTAAEPDPDAVVRPGPVDTRPTATTAGPGDESEPIGAVIGAYRLIETIGEGGMGTVYRAVQSHPVKRQVALKVIKPGMDSRQVIARFEAERQALALMDHPNIAKVLDAGATDRGHPYFVMELVQGQPITSYCDAKKLSLRERLELFIPVCHAVRHAHQKGVIHRDLKPSNVLVGLYDGVPVPKVIDFGVAKATGPRLTEATLFTGLGAVVGTLEYMSPEQARLDSVDVDTRSDIYSLGVLLYELLTGTTPLSPSRLKHQAMVELLRIIREEEPPKPSTKIKAEGGRMKDESETTSQGWALFHHPFSSFIVHPSAFQELDWIVMKALEKDRSRRYETADGLALDLQRFLADEPVEACPPSAWYRYRKFARRHRALFATGLVTGLAVLLAVGALAVSYARVRVETQAREVALQAKGAALLEAQTQQRRATAEAQRAEAQSTIAQKNEQTANVQTALANRRLYASQMNLAMQAAKARELPRVLELLEGQRPTESAADPRGFEWYYLWRLCHGGRRVPIKGHAESVLGLAFSPDGRTLASASWDGTVRLWDTATGGERKVLPHEGPSPWQVAYSPDGRFLASGGQEATRLILWDAATNARRWTIPQPMTQFAFTADSKRIAGCIREGERYFAIVLDVETGRERDRIELNAEGVAVGFTADGKALVTFTGRYNGATSQFQCWGLDDHRARYRVAVPEGLNAATLSSDRSLIIAGTGGGTGLFRTETGERLLFAPSLSSARGLAISPDNKLLACGLENRRVVVAGAETGEPVFEETHLGASWAVAFSPDGTMFASGSLTGGIHLRNVAASVDAPPLRIANISDLAFSADGKRLFVGNSGRPRIIDTAQGTEIAELPQTDVKAISANQRTLARVTNDGKVTAWETNSGRMIAELPIRVRDSDPGMVLSPDGERGATFVPWRGDTWVTLWDLGTGEGRTLRPDAHWGTSAHCAEFSPDGSLLAAGFQFYYVTIWDVAGGRVRREFAYGAGMTVFISLAWAPDGRTLAAGTDRGDVVLWDTRTGARIVTIRGHALPARSLAFTPDGKTLATGSDDKTIKLWDTLTGQERCTLSGHNGAVTKLRFSPEGTLLASASRDGTLRFWRASTDADALARRPDPVPSAPRAATGFEQHQAALALLGVENVGAADAIEAVALTREALRHSPGSGVYRITLALAHLRAGQWREAVETIDGLEQRGSSRSDMAQCSLIKALALWGLDQKQEARAAYDFAVKWRATRPDQDDRTERLQLEAARLLGLPFTGAADELPPVAIDTSKRFEELRRQLAEIDQRPAPSPTDPHARLGLARDYLALATAANEAGDIVTVEAAARSAFSRFVELVLDDAPGGRYTFEAGLAANTLRDLLIQTNRKLEALPIAVKAAEFFAAAARARLDNAGYQDPAASAQRRLEWLARELGRNQVAEAAERGARDVEEIAAALRKLPRIDEVLTRIRPLIERRDWKRAAEELDKGLGQRPLVEPSVCYRIALIRLLADDAAGYAKVIESMSRRLLSNEWPHEIGRTLTIHPRGAGNDPEALIVLVREAEQFSRPQDADWYLLNLGLAHYRAGRYEQALAHLKEAPGREGYRVLWPALAMVEHKLGHPEEARRWLDKAHAHFKEIIDGGPEALKEDMKVFWEDWAYFEVMLREADALIAGEPPRS